MAVNTISNLAVVAIIVPGMIAYRYHDRMNSDSFRATGALAIWVLGCSVIEAFTVGAVHANWSGWLVLIANTWAAAVLAHMAWRKRSMPR